MRSERLAEAERYHDDVVSPSHYTRFSIDAIDIERRVIRDVMRAMIAELPLKTKIFRPIKTLSDLGFACSLLKDVIKYIYRSPYKGNESKDLKKASFFFDRFRVECWSLGINYRVLVGTSIRAIETISFETGGASDHSRAIVELNRLVPM